MDEYKEYEGLCDSYGNVTFLGFRIEEVQSTGKKDKYYLAEIEERDVICYSCKQKRDSIRTMIGWQPGTSLHVVKKVIEAALER